MDADAMLMPRGRRCQRAFLRYAASMQHADERYSPFDAPRQPAASCRDTPRYDAAAAVSPPRFTP